MKFDALECIVYLKEGLVDDIQFGNLNLTFFPNIIIDDLKNKVWFERYKTTILTIISCILYQNPVFFSFFLKKYFVLF
jgi:hypothetical protein